MLIGVTGTIGAGKGALAKYLQEKGFRHVSVSDFLAAEVTKTGHTATRVARREMGNRYRAQGPTALIEEVLSDANPQKEDVVVESLHTVPEVQYVQGLGGTVISVDAPPEVRHARIKIRVGEKDPDYEIFVAEEGKQMASSDPNENNLRAAMESADYRLENAGTESELFEKVDGILGEND